MGPGRGVGNLLSKLIDGDGSLAFAADQESLQNPGQLLMPGIGSAKREITNFVIQPVPGSDHSQSMIPEATQFSKYLVNNQS